MIKTNDGITLIELVMVVSVIGILVVALGFQFQGWMGRYRAENQIKEIYTDLMNARARAMTNNRIHFARLLDSSSYAIYEDDSDGSAKVPDGDGVLQIGAGDSADTQLAGFPKTVEYILDWNNNTVAAPTDLVFNADGTIGTPGFISVFVDKDGDGERDFTSDNECIEILQTRISIGALDDNGTPSKSDDECVTK
jgi:Tfp pilus assembly protein FimT